MSSPANSLLTAGFRSERRIVRAWVSWRLRNWIALEVHYVRSRLRATKRHGDVVLGELGLDDEPVGDVLDARGGKGRVDGLGHCAVRADDPVEVHRAARS